MRKLLYILVSLPILAMAQSTDQNWVKSKTYKTQTSTPITSPTPAEAITQVVYYDGLGRPIQQIAYAQSNSGKDIVTHIEYDAFGRQVKENLPFVSSTGASLNIKTDETISFYGTNNVSVTGNTNFETTNFPFSQKAFENSPLNRVLKQAAPGDPWSMGSGKEIKYDYQTNIVKEVKLYKATASWNASNSVYDITFVDAGFYTGNELYKSVTHNENSTGGTSKKGRTEEFKNKFGQIVLKRTFNNNEAHDTYYVYDQFNNLTYVIPPAVNGVIDQIKLDDLGYQYKYDHRNRLVEKKYQVNNGNISYMTN